MSVNKYHPISIGYITVFIVALTMQLCANAMIPAASTITGPAIECVTPFFRQHTQLKDHTIFYFQGYYYLAAIQIYLSATQERKEHDFAYARTRDFCTWEDLGSVLSRGEDGEPDESAIWAPHVIEENGSYYMFYTGVNRNVAQSIMLAVSKNPADPKSWQKMGVVFRPNHTNMVYAGAHKWSDNRDPMILKQQGQYYLYYTGKDTSGGVVGVATSASITGTWQDWGAVVQTSLKSMPESPFVLENGGVYYMMYNDTGGNGPTWSWAVSPLGPWQPEHNETIGWAHDFVRIPNSSSWLVSYVQGDGESIHVTPLTWVNNNYPLRIPRIGSRTYLPALAFKIRNDPPNDVIKLIP